MAKSVSLSGEIISDTICDGSVKFKKALGQDKTLNE